MCDAYSSKTEDEYCRKEYTLSFLPKKMNHGELEQKDILGTTGFWPKAISDRSHNKWNTSMSYR